MIKKIDIAGLQLDNYTVREMLMRVDRRISEKILTTIEEVNMDTLALAESDEEVKQSLEACDYTVIADEGILRAVSADTLQRRHEIEDHDFFYELFKRLERNDKKIFVIAESQKAVDEAEEFLLGLFDRARISGKGVLDDSPGCGENLVNEINIVSPDVIASFLPSPSQEKFLLHNREKLLMNLWYGIGNNKFMGKKYGFIGKIRKMLDVKRLTHLIKLNLHFPKHLKYFELRPLLLLHYVPWNRLFPHNNLRLLYTDSQDLQIYHNLPKLSHLN